MGGASILVFLFVLSGELLRTDSLAIDQKLDSLVATFSVLALVCNYPHFLLAYKFAYARDLSFIFKNWLQLIFVPTFLIGIFTLAYFGFGKSIDEYFAVSTANSWAAKIGISFDLGQVDDIGQSILSFSIWGMLMCVGWHYSKQVFGSMMVYAKYDQYPISKSQRLVLKICLLSVAVANFFTLSGQSRNQYSYLGLKINTLIFPKFLSGLTTWVSVLILAYLLFAIVFKNYRTYKKWPSINFAVPFLAFYLWWFPWFVNPLFYIVLAPFFHCLQYLPFAYRMTNHKNAKPSPARIFRNGLLIFGVILLGFLIFDAIPMKLDQVLRTQWHFGCAYFLISTIVFMNIHHFFIDSVVWRLNQNEVKKALF